MNLQIIKSVDGKDEYVLLPIGIYRSLQKEIASQITGMSNRQDFVPFEPEDYVNNPVALTRIKAGMTQNQLANRMEVTQAYISKIERQSKVSAKLLHKVRLALSKKR